MKTYIASIGTASPKFKTPQMKIGKFMSEAAQLDEEESKRLFLLYKASGINYRYSVVPDFGRENGNYEFFPNTVGLEPFPTISQRMELYHREALGLSLQSISACLNRSNISKEEITHLITVSCTGMYAPGIDIEITEAMGLSKSIHRTCINFMGCYAAFNALKVADSFCKSQPNANVLIVAVELCTIHYQKNKDWDDILSNALFSDGAAAVLLSSKKHNHSCLTIESFYCDIASEGKKDMSWKIDNHGFQMTLSSYVPSLIRNGIKRLTNSLLERSGLSLTEIYQCAIHPGGKKILEVIEEELSLSRNQTHNSFDVLREYGNMSSPTVLFVLERILYSLSLEDHDKNILSFAFGPGLTLESMTLKSVVPIGVTPANQIPHKEKDLFINHA
jgi:predicted naringenin-chalcone synthase